MKVESGNNELVVQSLTHAFTTKLMEANTSVDIDVTVGDSIVINIFAPKDCQDNDGDQEPEIDLSSILQPQAA